MIGIIESIWNSISLFFGFFTDVILPKAVEAVTLFPKMIYVWTVAHDISFAALGALYFLAVAVLSITIIKLILGRQ